jgi:hypothetical protein
MRDTMKVAMLADKRVDSMVVQLAGLKAAEKVGQ